MKSLFNLEEILSKSYIINNLDILDGWPSFCQIFKDLNFIHIECNDLNLWVNIYGLLLILLTLIIDLN